MIAVMLGILAARFDTFPLDREVTRWIYDRGSWYGPLAGLTNRYNVLLAAIAGVGGCLVLLARRDYDSALLLPLAAAARPLLDFAKTVVDRPRPTDIEVRDAFGDSSFPSGHVMTAVAFFGLWFLLAPVLAPARLVLPVRFLALIVVVLHAFGRMWAGVHWLSDTYGGVIWMAAVLCALMSLRAGMRKANRASPSSVDARF